MNKLVIETQYLENYGTLEDPYMKFKGGNTYVMPNCGDLNANEIATLVAQVRPYITTTLLESNGGCEEYVIDSKVVLHREQVCPEWETPIDFCIDQFNGNVNFMKVYDNREDGWMRKEILEVTETWTNNRENYKKEFLMDDGDFCVGDKEANAWLKQYTKPKAVKRAITF
tara:strand:+ start:369 stop:878 length:510 start_codon:yes stop_codon:yes gene_type:complete